MIESYPLSWPEGFKRNQTRKRSRFELRGLTIAKERDHVLHELKLMGATKPIISSNLRTRNDGLPMSNQKNPLDPGVAVYFTFQGSQKALSCDAFISVEENLRAIALTISSMRAMDRYECSDMLERMFTGFLALPAQASWAEILGVSSTDDYPTIRKKYLELATKHHPDSGSEGDHDRMVEINRAHEQAKREKGVA